MSPMTPKCSVIPRASAGEVRTMYSPLPRTAAQSLGASLVLAARSPPRRPPPAPVYPTRPTAAAARPPSARIPVTKHPSCHTNLHWRSMETRALPRMTWIGFHRVSRYADGVHLFGLTGGIASGRNVVAARPREQGVPVIDADKLAREAVRTDALADRRRLRERTSSSATARSTAKAPGRSCSRTQKKRKALNAIVHPPSRCSRSRGQKELRDEEASSHTRPRSSSRTAWRPFPVVVSAPTTARSSA